jgi:predicted transcriptional regulator
MGTVNVRMLKAKLTELGINITELGEKMGYNKATIYRRLKDNGAGLSVSDANQIIKILNLTRDESVGIFFSQLVA